MRSILVSSGHPFATDDKGFSARLSEFTSEGSFAPKYELSLVSKTFIANKVMLTNVGIIKGKGMIKLECRWDALEPAIVSSGRYRLAIQVTQGEAVLMLIGTSKVRELRGSLKKGVRGKFTSRWGVKGSQSTVHIYLARFFLTPVN